MNFYPYDHVASVMAGMLDKPVEQYAGYQSSTILMDFAEQLINYRIEHHLNQTQLAHELGISQPMISQYESGSNNITVGRLCEICEKLNLVFRGKFASAEKAGDNPSADLYEFNSFGAA